LRLPTVRDAWQRGFSDSASLPASRQQRPGEAHPGAIVIACDLGLELVALGTLAQKLAIPADGFRLLACPSLRRLLVVPSHAHFAVEALALHLLLQRAERLVDIVVANLNLDDGSYSQADDNGTTKPAPSTEGFPLV
jgi:hypothetical protein